MVYLMFYLINYNQFIETPYCWNKSDATKWNTSRTIKDCQDNYKIIPRQNYFN